MSVWGRFTVSVWDRLAVSVWDRLTYSGDRLAYWFISQARCDDDDRKIKDLRFVLVFQIFAPTNLK
jgi:hypothetical protein